MIESDPNAIPQFDENERKDGMSTAKKLVVGLALSAVALAGVCGAYEYKQLVDETTQSQLDHPVRG